MIRKEVEKKAFDYHNNGFHCAEAVSKAIVELYGNGSDKDIPRVATAFGGGAVMPFEGTCGALTGGLLAIGSLYGRNESGIEESKNECFQLANKLGKRFVEEVGSVSCTAILGKFGEQKNMNKCKKLSGIVAGMLSDILEEKEKVKHK